MFEMLGQIKFRLEDEDPYEVSLAACYEQEEGGIDVGWVTNATGEKELETSDPLAILVTEFLQANFSRLWRDKGAGRGEVIFIFVNQKFLCQWTHEVKLDMKEEHYTVQFFMEA